MSSGWPNRPSGILDSNAARAASSGIAGISIGVSMKPGHTALARMRSGPRRCASERVSPMSPCLDATYDGMAP